MAGLLRKSYVEPSDMIGLLFAYLFCLAMLLNEYSGYGVAHPAHREVELVDMGRTSILYYLPKGTT